MEIPEDQPKLPRAPYPAPPPFWKHFTTSNLAQLQDLQSTNSTSTTDAKPTLSLALTYLTPPPLPKTDYNSFGPAHLIHPSATRVPDDDDLLFDPSTNVNYPSLLLKLTKSLLLNFLELITILSQNPNEAVEKLSDLNRLMVNVHAVINMWRPHQAREAVREMLEGMVLDGEEELRKADVARTQMEAFLEQVQERGLGSVAEVLRDGKEVNGVSEGRESVDGMSREDLEEAKSMWDAVREIANG